MDVGKSFTYVFADPRWVTKLIIGGVMALLAWLIIPAFILLGYVVQIVRNMLAGQEHPLPEWNDFGAHLADGFKVFVVFLVYLIPGIILNMLSGGGDRGFIGGFFGLLAFLYLFGIQLFFPAVLKAYLDGGNSIGAGFQFQQIIEWIRPNLGNFIIVWLLSIVASIIGGAGFIVFCIGALFTLPYSFMVRGHLWGQLLVQLRDSSAPPTPPLLPDAPAQ